MIRIRKENCNGYALAYAGQDSLKLFMAKLNHIIRNVIGNDGHVYMAERFHPHFVSYRVRYSNRDNTTTATVICNEAFKFKLILDKPGIITLYRMDTKPGYSLLKFCYEKHPETWTYGD